MKLQSVRALKKELFTLPSALMKSVATTRTFSAFAARRETAGRTMNGIALGVTMAKKQYRLAIRLQQSGPLISALTAHLAEIADSLRVVINVLVDVSDRAID